MSWLRDYGYSDCVFCDIVAHKPWEPAAFVYEDCEVAVFHNVLGWIPVMLLAVPRGRVAGSSGMGERHYEQHDLWRSMGRLGAVAMALGRAHCRFDDEPQFRLVSNIGSLALQTQSHAHLHILGSPFQPAYPDLRCDGRLVYEDADLRAFAGQVDSRSTRGGIHAVMVVPRAPMSQDEFFAGMEAFGERILELAAIHAGQSYRLLAEVGSHSPIPSDGAHLFILGGGSLGHYV